MTPVRLAPEIRVGVLSSSVSVSTLSLECKEEMMMSIVVLLLS